MQSVGEGNQKDWYKHVYNSLHKQEKPKGRLAHVSSALKVKVKHYFITILVWLGGLVVKTSACYADGRGSIPGLDTTR